MKPVVIYSLPRTRSTPALYSCKRAVHLCEPFSATNLNKNKSLFDAWNYRAKTNNKFVSSGQWDKLVTSMNDPNTATKTLCSDLGYFVPARTWFRDAVENQTHDIFVLEREDRKAILLSFLIACEFGWGKHREKTPYNFSVKHELIETLHKIMDWYLSFYPKKGKLITYENLPESHFDKKTSEETERELLSIDPHIYTQINKSEFRGEIIEEVKKLVKENYSTLKVSVSMLNNFFECPWEWYFRSFLRLPEPKSNYLTLGTIVHGTIEYVLKQEKLPRDEEIKNKIENDFVKENIDNKIDRERLIKKAIEAVKLWIKNYSKDVYDNHKSEYPISFKDKDFPNLLIYGKIDLLETDRDGNTRITDFKTGSSKTKNEIEKIDEEGRLSKYMRQLAMYTYLLRGEKKDVMIDKSRLLFLEEDVENKNSLYETHIDLEKIDLLKRDIADYEEFLKTGEFVNRKCQVKAYGGEECEYCKLAKKILLK